MRFDCFLFLNELELLDVRLRAHWENIDKFVICESTKTFWGDAKLLYFQENKHQFLDFAEKIIHLVVDDMPGGDDPNIREAHQRNAFASIINPSSSDLVFLSDVDEFFDFRVINGKAFDRPVAVQMFNHIGFMNLRRRDFYYHPKIIPGSCWPSRKPNEWRFLDLRESFDVLPEGGWHFGYLGGIDQIEYKILSGSHRFGNPTWESTLSRFKHLGVFGAEGHCCIVTPFTDALYPAELARHAQRLTKKGYLLK
jgi:hypothetical protein